MPSNTVADTAQAKVFFGGTHRIRPPEQTWAAISELLPEFGITRIADVTGLDTLGVPVAMAVRPLARSLTVSQGKGQSLLLAKISAAMESIEFWHGENVRPPIGNAATPAADLALPYRVDQVSTGPDSLVTEATPVDWVDSVGMISGATVPMPVNLVTLPHDPRPWSPPGLRWSSNGVAAGNSPQEACLHALYEIIERDAVTRRPDAALLESVDPTSVTEQAGDDCAELVVRILAAGTTLTITRVPSRFDVPCFGATVWSPDFPITCLGWGAHLDARVALSRAVTEAAQSRLTAISGTRDDLPPIYRYVRADTSDAARPGGPVRRWAELAPVGPGAFTDIAEELGWVCERVRAVTGVEPLRCDLGVTETFAVVRMLAPGTSHNPDRLHSTR